MLKHLAIIPDGNRRYAEKKGLLAWKGHEDGINNLETIAEYAFRDFNISVVTVYAFSMENFGRSRAEVNKLMVLFKKTFEHLAKSEKIHKNEVRIAALGRTDLLPAEVRKAIRLAEDSTKKYKKHFLNMAIAYDGRTEIVDGIRKLVKQKKKISEKAIADSLYFSGFPPPDLIIRTSGEQRLSGFLLWNSSYAELYFCDKLWPEFSRDDLKAAIEEFERRERRYGR